MYNLLWVFCTWYEVRVQHYSFACGYPLILAPFIEKTVIPPSPWWNCLHRGWNRWKTKQMVSHPRIPQQQASNISRAGEDRREAAQKLGLLGRRWNPAISLAAAKTTQGRFIWLQLEQLNRWNCCQGCHLGQKDRKMPASLSSCPPVSCRCFLLAQPRQKPTDEDTSETACRSQAPWNAEQQRGRAQS